MDHKIEKTSTGYHCIICLWNWKSKPRSDCPDVPHYEWHKAPEHLLSKAQLAKKGLKPGGPYRAIVATRRDTTSLYHIAEAVPFTPEEIAAEKERRWRMRHRTCTRCQKVVRREKWDTAFEVCDTCLPVVLEERRIRRERKREEEEREFEAFLVKARDEAILGARAWLALGNHAVILDTETTGLDLAEAIEIAIIGLDGTVLLNQRVKPKGEISAGAYQVHGISAEMLAECPTWFEVYPRVNELLNGKTVIVYNAQFDMVVLQYSNSRYLLPFPFCEWGCAMETYAKYYGEWSGWHGSFKWQRLQGGDHSAAGDCQATLALIKRMAETKLSTEE